MMRFSATQQDFIQWLSVHFDTMRYYKNKFHFIKRAAFANSHSINAKSVISLIISLLLSTDIKDRAVTRPFGSICSRSETGHGAPHTVNTNR